jgi:lipopolysaccharide/colanic/teichoic acid biosynthesis glycosyltransferase
MGGSHLPSESTLARGARWTATPCVQSAATTAGKRLLDLLVAVPACLLLAPLLIAIAMAIKFESPGPALFRQQRRGRRMHPFTMLKFRSLHHDAPDPHDRYEMVSADPRITRVGAFIRRTSLDELPQLFNVVAGSMSLVGPRPLVEWESQEAFLTHSERYRVKPGITGFSQVQVRNSVDFHARLDKDVEYARSCSIGMDLKILLRTPLALIKLDSVYPDDR